MTACTRCYRQYTCKSARDLRWRCPADGGRITKGVRDRARELNRGGMTRRPPYLRILPLGEIIRACLGMSSARTRRCRDRYRALTEALGTEIEILVDLPAERIGRVDEPIAGAIAAFRAGAIRLHPGGGGRYGTFSLGPEHPVE